MSVFPDFDVINKLSPFDRSKLYYICSTRLPFPKILMFMLETLMVIIACYVKVAASMYILVDRC